MSYTSWRISFQSDEQAAKSAYMQVCDLYLKIDELNSELQSKSKELLLQTIKANRLQGLNNSLVDSSVSDCELIEILGNALENDCAPYAHHEHNYKFAQDELNKWKEENQ